jgi:MoaE-MoaD fusion protein
LNISVLYFGQLRERVSQTARELVALPPGATVDDLVTELCSAHPGLTAFLRHIKVAVNEAMSSPGQALQDGDEVALIPPVAGGSGPYCKLTDQPLSVDEAIAAVVGPDQGAVTLFLGFVRGRKNGADVVDIDYQAYASMARASLMDIARRCEARGPDVRVAVAHRIGMVKPGEAAVVVAASATHRALAYEVSRECIELIKAETPIWKKETRSDGVEWVEAVEGLGGTGLDWSAAAAPAASAAFSAEPAGTGAEAAESAAGG